MIRELLPRIKSISNRLFCLNNSFSAPAAAPKQSSPGKVPASSPHKERGKRNQSESTQHLFLIGEVLPR
jgi:hypothetical protein